MTSTTITERADGTFTITLQDRLILSALADALAIVADDNAVDVDADRAAAVAIAGDMVMIIADALADPLRYRQPRCNMCGTADDLHTDSTGTTCHPCQASEDIRRHYASQPTNYAQRCEDAPCCGCCD